MERGGAILPKCMKRILAAGVVAAAAFVLAAPVWAQSRGAARGRSPSSPSRLQAPSQNVPGLGFDYAHLAAITPPSRASRANRRLDSGQFITPIFGWGLPAYSAPQPLEPQPLVIVLQQPPPTIVLVPAPDSRDDAVRAEPAPPIPSVSPTQAPLRELGPFILLRRDGQIVLAVAFSASSDRLTYITQAGARRSFPLAELDVETTLQMNEAAGRPIILPN